MLVTILYFDEWLLKIYN